MCFFGGAVLTNAIPHLANGLSGRPFQSPFAKPHGRGLSSSQVNVVWGFVNLLAAWLLLGLSPAFDVHRISNVLLTLAGGLVLGIWMARHFGRLHGGYPLEKSDRP
ncbi:hypothetical protein HBF24_02570 [Oleiagrimonas sp. C23AA]|nr:hypothetical protein [Oleiagrimonas sp. C23AA]